MITYDKNNLIDREENRVLEVIGFYLTINLIYFGDPVFLFNKYK